MAQMAKCFLCKPDSLCSIPKIYSEKKEPTPQSCLLTSHAYTHDSPLPHLIITITKIKCRNVKQYLWHILGTLIPQYHTINPLSTNRKTFIFWIYTHSLLCWKKYIHELPVTWAAEVEGWSEPTSVEPAKQHEPLSLPTNKIEQNHSEHLLNKHCSKSCE